MRRKTINRRRREGPRSLPELSQNHYPKMFANLTKGAPVYVLDLRGTPKYYMATLEEAPQPYFPAPGNFPPSQPSVSFPIGDQKWVVPVNADMVTKDGLTVTTTRERLIDAVNAARQQSQNVVDSYERHKANLELFDQIMREISPAYAGQAQRDEDMQKLREEVGQLRQMQAEFLSMKSSLDAFLKSQTPSKTSK